jgi:adenylosuccinate synthase
VRLGLSRLLFCRHGPGPFPSEDKDILYKDMHNSSNAWQGSMRWGHIDLILLAYSLTFLRIDCLGLTCLDFLAGKRLFFVERYMLDDSLAGQLEEGDKKLLEFAQNGQVSSISPSQDLSSRQHARRTFLLLRCRPVMEEVPGMTGVWRSSPAQIEVLAKFLELRLQKPVVFFSAGPYPEDRWHTEYLENMLGKPA